MADGIENWRLILDAAKALTAAGQTPFTPGQHLRVDLEALSPQRA
jgi:hypothetical protein